MTETPKRLPLHDGDEYDVFTRWRRVLCWTQRAGACKRVKRRYAKRMRHVARLVLRSAAE